MNWEALGAIAELVGAVGVIATLAYLAVQIRQNTVHLEHSTRSTREAALLASRAMVNEFNALLVADPTLARIFRIGLGTPSTLDADDRVRFDLLMGKWFHDVETLFLLHQRGSFDSDQWTPFEARLTTILATPGGRDSWERLSGAPLGEPFSQFVKELLASEKLDE